MNPKHNRSIWLVLLCTTALAGACGGDDDDDGGDDSDDAGAAVCGDGIINGTEECDGTTLGSSTCATVGEFNGGELACSSDCTFDVSACTNEIPETCGNGAVDAGEDCDGTDLAGASCDSLGYDGGELACAADCSFDAAACEASTSSQIADVRAATDGSGLSLPIDGAIVTYVKPVLGEDPAGFFVQADRAGPALFVAPGVVPELAVGDTVSFTVTEKVTSAGLPRAEAIEGLTVDDSGADVQGLVQDVTGAKSLVSALDDFDSELVELDARITSDFTGAGTSAVAATISTTGLPDDPGLRFRLGNELRDTLDLASGCVVSIGPTPLWRFNTTAQPSIWSGDEVSITSCNAPRLLSASAPGATTVVLTFDRRIDPASVQAADFTVDNGLDVTAAAVEARTVTLTTAVQAAQTAYTVTVTGVNDTLGVAIDDAADESGFTGFGDVEVACGDNNDNDSDGDIDCADSDCSEDAVCDFGAQLYLWELDSDQDGAETAEFIEVVNRSGETVNFSDQGWYLLFVNGNGDTVYRAVQLGDGAGTVADGDVWTVGNVDSTTTVDQETLPTGNLQNGTDGVLLVSCNACTGAADFPNGFDPGNGTTVTGAVSGATGEKRDAIIYGTDEDPELQAKLLDAAIVPDDSADQSLQRTSLGNWLGGVPTPDVE